MRPLAILLLLTSLAGCSGSTAQSHDSAALEGYIPPGVVDGGPNKLFGPAGINTNFKFNTPW